jgi:hypothetical protein
MKLAHLHACRLRPSGYELGPSRGGTHGLLLDDVGQQTALSLRLPALHQRSHRAEPQGATDLQRGAAVRGYKIAPLECSTRTASKGMSCTAWIIWGRYCFTSVLHCIAIADVAPMAWLMSATCKGTTRAQCL